MKKQLVCLAGLLSCWSVADGQVKLSLNDALQQALAANPQVGSAQARVDQSVADRRQAGLGPNPRLVAQSEDIRFWGNEPHNFADTTEDYLYVGQVIESGGKRARRVDVATSSVRSSELQLEAFTRQLRARVSSAYWNAAGAARIRDLLKQSVATYEGDVTYARNRVEQGVMPESDLMRIQIERDRVQAQELAATRDADVALIELYHVMGKSSFPDTELTDSLEQTKTVSPPEISMVLNTRPEARLARERVTMAEANVSLQKANAKPDPEVLAGYKREMGLDTLYVAAQVDLPFRNRNQGNIESSVAAVHSAKAELAYTEESIRAELESAKRAYHDDQAILASMPQTLARARETEHLARAAYREGAIDLLRVMDAERNRIDVETQYYRALIDLQQSIVNLILASGGLP